MTRWEDVPDDQRDAFHDFAVNQLFRKLRQSTRLDTKERIQRSIDAVRRLP